jgi:hypothetical protein
VAPREVGPIDINANVNYRNVSVKAEYAPNDRVNTFLRVGYFTEDRINGKVGEVNDTRWTTVNGGLQARLPDRSDLQARVYGTSRSPISTSWQSPTRQPHETWFASRPISTCRPMV